MTFTPHKIMKPIAIASIMLFSILAAAQVSVAPSPMPHLQFFDANGLPLSNGRICTFNAGTTTPVSTYADSTGTSQNLTCIPLDSGGYGDIWLANQSYKFIAQDQNGVQQWTADGITGYLGLLNLANTWTFSQLFTQPITVTPADNQIVLGAPGSQTILDAPPSTGSITLHFPTLFTDTVVTTLATQSIANKTINNGTINSSLIVTPTITNPTINGCPVTFTPGTCILIPNNGTGTILNALTVITGGVSPAQALRASTVTVSGVVGITVANAGNSGSAVIQQSGISSCIFDNATSAGDYFIPSVTTAGDCHDIGSTARNTTGEILGTVQTTNAGAGTYQVLLAPQEILASGSQRQTITNYANATTSFTTLGFTYNVLQNQTVAFSCYFIWQASAATAGPQFKIATSALTVNESLAMTSAVTATTVINAASVQTPGTALVSNTGVVSTATDLPVWLSGTINPTGSSGSLDLQAAANGVGTLTIKTGSCTFQ